jgi:hypothetical protein
MEHKISEPNARIDVADVLRGLAVMGIIILHSIEHFNFYSFPDTVPCEWMKFTDKAIWNGLFLSSATKHTPYLPYCSALVSIYKTTISNAAAKTFVSGSSGEWRCSLSSGSSMQLSLPVRY